MVNVSMTVQTPTQRAKARMTRVQQMQVRPGLRVEPANDDMRRLLKHPRVGGFRSEGSTEWPDDNFTRKRLRDGDIKLAEEKKPAARPAAHHRGDAA